MFLVFLKFYRFLIDYKILLLINWNLRFYRNQLFGQKIWLFVLVWRKQFDVVICTLVSHEALSCWSLHNNQARGIQFAFHFSRMTNNPIFKERRKFFLLHILLGAVPIDTLFLSSIIKFESLCIFISHVELFGVPYGMYILKKASVELDSRHSAIFCPN